MSALLLLFLVIAMYVFYDTSRDVRFLVQDSFEVDTWGQHHPKHSSSDFHSDPFDGLHPDFEEWVRQEHGGGIGGC